MPISLVMTSSPTGLAQHLAEFTGVFDGDDAARRRFAIDVVRRCFGAEDVELTVSGRVRIEVRRPDPLSPVERDALAAMTRMLTAAVEAHRAATAEQSLHAELDDRSRANARLSDRLSRRRVEREQLLRIQRAITERQPIMSVLDSILDSAVSLIPSAFVGLQLVEPDGSTARLVGLVMEQGKVQRTGHRIRVGEGLAGQAIAHDRFMIADDYASSPLQVPEMRQIGITTMMASPVHRDGGAVGALIVASWEAGRTFSQDEQHLLQSLAEHASLAFNDASAVDAVQRSLERAVHDATHDQLTGLANRKQAIERLDDLAACESGATVVFVDVDRFKAINDAYGHSAGDDVLREVARRLGDATRVDDLVARLSGDEFLAIVPTPDEEAGVDMAARIAAALRFSVTAGRREVGVTASVGCARMLAGETADDAVANADVAMYRAKQAGGGRMVRFDEEMRDARRSELTLEREIRHGIDTGQFEAHLQPIVEIATGRVVGAEALARWRHPVRGLVAPAGFVAAAEAFGMIGQLDSVVLRDAISWVRRWDDADALPDDFHVSVNVSADQFQHLDLVASVNDALGTTDPGRLWLEITETTMMRNVERSLATMSELQSLGVRLAVDDFGTGWSSLAYLKQFPVAALKIDRSFVSGLCNGTDDAAIVEATIRMAGALDLAVVAEGVETDEQSEALHALGCGLAQGFLYSRPVPPEQFAERWLTAPVGATVPA